MAASALKEPWHVQCGPPYGAAEDTQGTDAIKDGGAEFRGRLRSLYKSLQVFRQVLQELGRGDEGIDTGTHTKTKSSSTSYFLRAAFELS